MQLPGCHVERNPDHLPHERNDPAHESDLRGRFRDGGSLMIATLPLAALALIALLAMAIQNRVRPA